MKAKKVAFLGVMGALAIVVSFLESLFNIPFLPPGAKPGLSNILTVSAFFLTGSWGAVYITVIKALFALITRGGIAFFLSFSGGIASTVIMILLFKMKKCPFSLTGISIIGAVMHNLMQLGASMVITKTYSLIYYLPALTVFALIAGSVTGLMLKALKPYIEKIRERNL